MNKGCRSIALFRILPLILVSSSLLYSAKHATLPVDETEAASMLAHHEIDSSLWEIVEPFYQQPISVPYGESGILSQLFPELDLNIPVSEAELTRYIPWDKKKISQFFRDYPELFFFKPILDFSMNVPVKSGRISMSVDRNGTTDRTSQRLQFSLDPVQWISVGGRVDFTEYTARWKNRILTISPRKGWSLTAGNVAPMADQHRLVSGSFGNRNPEMNDIADNWLYGEKRGWNTLIVNFSTEKILDGLKIQPFIHKRLSERIAGFSSEVSINQNIKTQIDIVGMDMKDIDDTLYYGVFSTRINYSIWSTELTVATSVKRTPTVPVRFDFAYSREMDDFNLEFLYFPEGFRGPVSKTIEDFIGTDTIFGSLCEDLFSYDLSWKHHIVNNVVIKPSLILKMGDMQVLYLNPGLFLSVQKELYRLIFGYQRFEPLLEKSIRIKDNFNIECSMHLNEKIDLQVDLGARSLVSNTWYFSTSLEPEFKPITGLQVTPGVTYRKYVGQYDNLVLSLANTLYLFNSIYSDVSIGKCISFNDKKGSVSAHAKMWFVF